MREDLLTLSCSIRFRICSLVVRNNDDITSLCHRDCICVVVVWWCNSIFSIFPYFHIPFCFILTLLSFIPFIYFFCLERWDISFIYFSHIFPGLWEISEKFLRIFFDGNGRNGRNGRIVTVVTEIQNSAGVSTNTISGIGVIRAPPRAVYRPKYRIRLE